MCISRYCQTLDIKNYEIKKDFVINKYYTDKYMGPHIDSYEESEDLKFSVLIYINDDYDGGEIEFKEQDVKIKPEAGSVLIFPTFKPFFHQSYPIQNGNKYFVLSEFTSKQ